MARSQSRPYDGLQRHRMNFDYLIHTYFSISIGSFWARKFGCFIIMSVSISRVCWNWSSTASHEGKRSDDRQSNQNQTEKRQAGLTILKSLKDANSSNGSQHIEDALELVVNCIPWRQKIGIGWRMKYVFLADDVINRIHFSYALPFPKLFLCLSVRLNLCVCPSIRPSVSPFCFHEKSEKMLSFSAHISP